MTGQAISKPRSHDDIAFQIRVNLGELKPRSGDLRGEILRHIGIAASTSAELAPVLNASAIRAKARKAEKALAVLGGGFPAEVTDALKREALFTKVTGPDKRFGFLQWICAHQACVLIEQFSKQPAVSSQNKNLHSIAQLIHEAVTGQRGSKAGMLRSCKAVLRWRKPSV